MNKVILGIGISGSGKTTILKKFAEDNGYYYISVDETRKEISGREDDQSVNSEAWDVSRRLLKYMYESGKTIVFDATFVKKKEREEFLGFLKDEGVGRIQGVFVDTPFEDAKKRNEGRNRTIRESSLMLQEKYLRESPPSVNEGFDALFRLDENAKIVGVETRVPDPELGKKV